MSDLEPRERVVVVRSEEETLALAAALAAELPGGSVVHLRGDLGTGKTRFAKGLARGLGLDETAVVSPTFTIVQIHAARPGAGRGLGLVHVDLYRIADPAELAELGLSELPGRGALAAVEWPERLAGHAAPGAIDVLIEDLGARRRRLTLTLPAPGPPPTRLL